MQISPMGIKLIKTWEGCHDTRRTPGRVTAYLCPAGVPTIGYGSTRYEDGRPVHYARPGEQPPADTIGLEQAEALLLHEIRQICEPAIRNHVHVPLSQPQFDALASFIFNVGAGAFANSTLLRLLNAGDYHGAADQFLCWIHAGGRVLEGLLRRRQAERALFLTGALPDGARPILVRGEQGESVLRLQQDLNRHGCALSVDGLFGILTERAVREFQGRTGLEVDGVVGPRTWRQLEEPAAAAADRGAGPAAMAAPQPVRQGQPA